MRDFRSATGKLIWAPIGWAIIKLRNLDHNHYRPRVIYKETSYREKRKKLP